MEVGKPKLMRKINREIIIQILRSNNYVTNRKIKEFTGLSRRTVDIIINSLRKSGIVSKVGYGKSSKEGGKKPVIYKFVPNSFYSIGIMIRELNISAGICNLNGKILLKDQVIAKWNKGKKKIIDQIVKLANNIIEKSNIDFSKFLGIGIGLPGIIDTKNGVVNTLTRHKNWENFNLVKELEKKLKLHIEIENENKLRALGEKWFGIAKDYKNFITIYTTKNGIGAGAVINNELISGHNFLVGEIGHIKIYNEKNNFKDFKNLEYLLGENHINNIIYENIKHKSYRKSPISKIIVSESGISMEQLFNIYNSGDNFAKHIMEKILNYFVILLNIIICTYDPDLIIIHGKYSLLNDEFFKKISDCIRESLFQRLDKEILIKKSIWTKEIGILGSAGIIMDKVSIESVDSY